MISRSCFPVLPVIARPVVLGPVFSWPVVSRPVFSRPVFSRPVFSWPGGGAAVRTGKLFSGRDPDTKACYRSEKLHRPETVGARGGVVARDALQLRNLARERFACGLARGVVLVRSFLSSFLLALVGCSGSVSVLIRRLGHGRRRLSVSAFPRGSRASSGASPYSWHSRRRQCALYVGLQRSGRRALSRGGRDARLLCETADHAGDSGAPSRRR